jgi:leucyl aminopeptidase (aminopeptidase T)
MIQSETTLELRVARRVVQEMYAVKPGEIVAITADKATPPAQVEAYFQACIEVGADPVVISFKTARDSCQAGMPDWPARALIPALIAADVWLETNTASMLYSDIWEAAMAGNPRLRYNCLGGILLASIERMFCGYDIPRMERILRVIASEAARTSRVRITSANGTDVTYETDARNPIDYDSGDYSAKHFGTPPGYANIVPKVGTMTGRIHFDYIQFADLSEGGEVTFDMQDGRITAFHGDLTENERIWGGADFGFGHTSPMDLPPDGQKASSHIDGVVCAVSMWFDDRQIMNNGEFVLEEIRRDAADLYTASSEPRHADRP